MLLIPSTFIFDLFIKQLKASDDKICILDFTSSPFKSDFGLFSAYPSSFAFLEQFQNPFLPSPYLKEYN